MQAVATIAAVQAVFFFKICLFFTLPSNLSQSIFYTSLKFVTEYSECKLWRVIYAKLPSAMATSYVHARAFEIEAQTKKK